MGVSAYTLLRRRETFKSGKERGRGVEGERQREVEVERRAIKGKRRGGRMRAAADVEEGEMGIEGNQDHIR